VEITDNHFHLDPSGRKELAVKDFIKAGGTRLVLVHKPYGSWKKIDSFQSQVKTTLKLAVKARETGAKVAVVAAPHPIELLKLLEFNSPSQASEIYFEAVDYCTSLVDEKKTVGLGELGRPHFEVEPSVWDLANDVLTESLSRAKEVDANPPLLKLWPTYLELLPMPDSPSPVWSNTMVGRVHLKTHMESWFLLFPLQPILKLRPNPNLCWKQIIWMIHRDQVL